MPDDDVPDLKSALREAPPTLPTPTATGLPLWAVRAIAIVLLLALVGVVVRQTWRRVDPPGPQAPAAVPDQHVHLRALKNTPMRVLVDGEVTVDRVVANGESVEADARDRVEVVLPAVENVKIEFNGAAVVPQGRQDKPRKLVFIDDLGTP